jgi:hypothetical protein
MRGVVRLNNVTTKVTGKRMLEIIIIIFLLFSTLFKTTFFSALQNAQVFKYTQVTKKEWPVACHILRLNFVHFNV